MITILTEHIGFHYLLTKIQLYTLILLEQNKDKDESIINNIFRIQVNEYIMYWFYCITFIEYILIGKTLLHNTNFFFPNDYKKNDKTIYKYFKDKYVRLSKSGVQIKKKLLKQEIIFQMK